MAKGLDSKFLHYGIRKDDLAMICGSYPLASSTTTGSVTPLPPQRCSGQNPKDIEYN